MSWSSEDTSEDLLIPRQAGNIFLFCVLVHCELAVGRWCLHQDEALLMPVKSTHFHSLLILIF